MIRLYKSDETGAPVAYHEAWVEPQHRRIVANNAIALLGGAANGLQLAGLATLQQQQQSNPAAMVFPQIDPHGQLQLVAQHPKQHLAINPSAQEAQATKNLSSIVRPLYLDHDSNCKSLVYRLSQFLSFH